MTKTNPKIRIRFSWLLYGNLSQRLHQLMPEDHRPKLRSEEECREKTILYQEAWKPTEEKILTGMCQCFGLTFYQEVVDVYIAPLLRPMSSPLIMNFRTDPDEFIDALTHELFHVLLTDNNENLPYGQALNQLYGNEEMLARNHVFIHTGLKYIYLDVLKEPYRLERDIEKHKNSPGYNRAWDIVEQEGYQNLIDKLKSYHSKQT